MNGCEIHWTEYFKALGPTFIAIFVAYVAYQQWQVNRANLREKLFERRFEVFQKTKLFLFEIQRDAKVTKEILGEFHSVPQVSRFLFDRDLSDYLESVRQHAINMRFHSNRIEHARSEKQRLDSIDKESQEIKWLSDQSTNLVDKFEPYLGFKKHK